MFGYLQIDESKIAPEDYRTYHYYRCGLCQVLRREYGLRGQVFLNNDMSFLLILLSGLYEPDEWVESFLCQIHPGKRRRAYINEITHYVAAMNLMLSCCDLRDNWEDDHSYASRMMAGMLSRHMHTVMAKYPRQAKALAEYRRKSAIFEASNEKNLDVIAGQTGNLMAEIFVWREDEWADELRCLGYYLGKYMYLMDAYEDLEKDAKTKQYNPFSRMAEESREDFETFCRLMLNSQLSECIRSFERLPSRPEEGLIHNILFYGVWKRYDEIHARHQKQKEKDIKKQVKLDKRIDRLENKQNRLKKEKKMLERQTGGAEPLADGMILEVQAEKKNRSRRRTRREE